MRRYRVVKKLGDGSQGVAYLAIDTQTGKDVVLKKIPGGSKSSEEVAICKQIRHPNIISCFDSFVENDFLYMVLTYAEGGDLESYLQLLSDEQQQLPLSRATRWFVQLASALQCCHEQYRTLHRDVKPANVFLNKALDTIYLGDFGVAKRLGGGGGANGSGGGNHTTSTFVGSPVWLSPEVVNGEPYSYASDAWGLGCVLYELIAGQSPFDTAGNLAALVMKVGNGDFEPLPPSTPQHIQRCVKGLLTVDVSKRWSISQALASAPEFKAALEDSSGYGVDAAPTPRGLASIGLGVGQFDNNNANTNNTDQPTSANNNNNRNAQAQPAPAKGLNTWMKGINQEFESLEKVLSPKLPAARGYGKDASAAWAAGGGGGRAPSNANSDAEGGSNANSRSDNPANANNNKAASPAQRDPSPAPAPKPAPGPTAGPSGGARLAAPAGATPGLNTWMKGMDSDFADLQRQLGKVGSAAAAGGGPTPQQRIPVPAQREAPPAPSAPTPNAAPAGGGGAVGAAPGLNTWMKGMDNDFADLQRQLGKVPSAAGGVPSPQQRIPAPAPTASSARAGGGGTASKGPSAASSPTTQQPPPLPRGSNAPQPASARGVPGPSPTAAGARNRRVNSPPQEPLGAGGRGGGGGANTDVDSADLAKWVKSKQRQITEIEGILEAFNKGNNNRGGGGAPVRGVPQPLAGNNLAQRASPQAAGGRSPPKSRSPQRNDNNHNHNKATPQQQQQQHQPLTAQQERFRKAQELAEAKQRKAEEDARQRAEVAAKAKAEKEREAVLQAEKDAKHAADKKLKDEKREREWKEFRLKMKEGRKEVADMGGVVQHDVVMVAGGGGGGGAAPLAGRRAVSQQIGGGLPAAPSSANAAAISGGIGSARVLSGNAAEANKINHLLLNKDGAGGARGGVVVDVSSPQPNSNQPFIPFGRRQSPASAMVVSPHPTIAGGGGSSASAIPPAPERIQLVTPLAAGNVGRPNSGPSATGLVPTPTAPRSRVAAPISVASLQPKGTGASGGGVDARHVSPTPNLNLKNPSPSAAAAGAAPKARGSAGVVTPIHHQENKNNVESAAEIAKHQAAIDRRQKQREEMLAMMQKDRKAASGSNNNSNDVPLEIVLPGNLRNLPQNKI